MKTIYSFTLSSDEYPSYSKRFNDDLRLFAYMLYNEVYNYYGDGDNVLNINPLIEYNDLIEFSNIDFDYRFISDINDDGYTYYEPFIVGKKTFCFTTFGDNNDERIIENSLDYIMRLLKMNYNVIINKYSYVANNINDERNRENTIRRIFADFGDICPIKTGIVAMIMKYKSMKKRIRNNKNSNNRCYNNY